MADHHKNAAVPSDVQYESDTEREVANVWGNLLQSGAVNRDSSFFEIGGTSLTVFAVAHRLREAFELTNQQLDASTIYAYPTLTDLASAIDRARQGDVEAMPQHGETVLVTLKQGSDSNLSPLFLVSSAGGTLGAYDKVVRALSTPRDVVGLRDPYLSDARNPAEGFQHWVQCYTDAVRRRQPSGPYHILAYSSAGAFGYELAAQLRAEGEEVALLALVDPVAMDCASQNRFGYWALRARSMRDSFCKVVRWGGQLRTAVPGVLRARRNANNANNWTLSESGFQEFATWAKTDRNNIIRFATLLELNTGLPFTILGPELDSVAPSEYMDVLLGRIAQVDANIDAHMITRALVQYDWQVRSQHHYQLQAYNGPVHLFDAAGPTSGLIAAQLRPYVQKLYTRSLSMAGLSDRMNELLGVFPEGLRAHYGCMRSDAFTEGLAAELDAALEAVEGRV